MIEEEKVWEALREVYDPEIPVNVVDLGLVYNVAIEDKAITVDMSLTAPGCPVAPYMQEQTAQKVKEATNAERVVVNIVWDPPWNPQMMSEDARLELGLA